MITLGSAGEDLTVVIPVGARFLTKLTASIPWPLGTVIELHLLNEITDDPVVWSAVISGSDATFDVAASQVTTDTADRPSVARLLYDSDGGGLLLWAHGTTRYV